MKILSIGNSFSQDAHRWIHKLAAQNGLEIETANLYIGGCSLDMHWDCYINNHAFYDLELNGNLPERKISIKEALDMEKWDIITLQQSSPFSGMIESYEPYLTSLANIIKTQQPQADIYFHQTWSYEIDFNNINFETYNNNQREMFEKIKFASEKAAESIGAKIIPTGTVIQKLRETVEEFNYKNDGLSLCRDGYHLSLNYGRYAAAATWIYTITGQKVKVAAFEDFNISLLEKIINAI